MMKSKTPEYRAWQDMRQRCENPRNKAFKHYGGRGINVCCRWQSFDNFLSDMGSRPDGMSIERLAVNGDYHPDNCKWATDVEQGRNRRVHEKPDVGVSFCQRDKTWHAWISVGGTSFNVGSFPDKESAVLGRKKAVEKYWQHGEPLEKRPPSNPMSGVSWNSDRKKWHAYRYVNRKRIDIGMFTELDAAVAARNAHGITPADAKEPT